MEKQEGQVLLIVVLIMVVGLTIGLSVASRAITTVRTSSEEENSQRAFAAAEAGIERFLKTTCTGPCADLSGSFANNATTYNASAITISGQEFLVHGGALVPKDNGADVWLSDYPNYANEMGNGSPVNMTFYWGDSPTYSNNAALVVVVLYDTDASAAIAPAIKKYAFEPDSTRQTTNHFSSVSTGATVAGTVFKHSATIQVTNGLLLRIIPIYYNSTIGIIGCDGAGLSCHAFPTQGKNISSVGSVGDAGKAIVTERKIVFYQGYPQTPGEFFNYTIFSP